VWQPTEGRYALTATLLSREIFRDYLKQREMSYQDLADEVTRLGRKEKPVPITCSRALIGFLAAGNVKGTNPQRARLITKALRAPDSLFVYQISRVAQDGKRPA
jgi:hypothetical protein